MRVRSFAEAADEYEDTVGQPISRMSVWRRTSETGQAFAAERAREAEEAGLPAKPGEGPRPMRVIQDNPIVEQANISSDGVMVRLRDEGWKEARVAAISRVQVLPPKGTRAGEQPGRRDHDQRVKLDQHSYVAGMWDADEFAPYQYAEGLRRGLDSVEILSSVNDGAPWIGRVTKSNWPKAPQVLDWSHAKEHIYDVAKVIWGEGSATGTQWAEARVEELWSGRVEDALQALRGVTLQYNWPEGKTDPVGYFEDNAERMRYDLFREAGYPIGSGTVESSAGNVVETRMRRPGPGWRTDHANGMLTLLAEYHSGRFNKTYKTIRKLDFVHLGLTKGQGKL